jgi:SNF2 family DNA or RNA helicase
MDTMHPLYQHQIEDVQFILNKPHVLNFSDAGTGKTRTSIEVIRARKAEGRTLVICPKSIMAPAWGDDLKKFAPELTYSLAYAHNRAEAFFSQSDVVITNHDAVTWIDRLITKNRIPILNNFCQLIIDESTAYKNDSQRSKSLIKLAQHFKYRLLMTGTPYTNSLTDIWRQVLICDQGQRLGNSFYRFRDNVCQGRQLGNGITIWEDKPNMEPLIYHLIQDICIRHRLEDCIDIPENTTQHVNFQLSKTHRKVYNTMEEDALIEIQEGTVTAFNAAILASKLLQIASGAVYDNEGHHQILDTDRYELIRDLAIARPQVIIAFNWQHQKEQLLKVLPDAAVIDGSVSHTRRTQVVNEFQKGNIAQILIHPKSGAHGLTLTAGHATIWASPTYSSEEFTQFNRRIYRAGQTKKTETILICAEKTIEQNVYNKLQGKLERMNNIMSLFDYE